MQTSFYELDPKWTPILIIYTVIMAISIVIVRSWYKKYKNIPDKQLTAKLVKTSFYYGHGESYYGLNSSFTKAKYEYFLNGNRHTIKLKCSENALEQVVLYYKKGRSDLRIDKRFELPIRYKIMLLFYFVIGTALITILISKILGYPII